MVAKIRASGNMTRYIEDAVQIKMDREKGELSVGRG
jgi:hypothetical protein